MSLSFKRVKEDFTCFNCGFKTKANGYTNHCSNCLWSRHIDENPGDRSVDCAGMMKPIDVEIKAGKYIIIHQCLNCGIKKKNQSQKEDNFEAVLKIASKSKGPLA